MDAVEVPAGHVHALERTRFGRADGDKRGVVGVEFRDGHIHADLGVTAEFDALGLHLFDAPKHQLLVQFEVRDAVGEQAARRVGAFIDDHGMSGAAQLLRGGESAWAAADDGPFFACALQGRLGLDKAVGPAVIGNLAFHHFDGHRRLVDAQYAGAFTGRGTDASGELGEVIGAVQNFQRFAPAVVLGVIVEVGDHIAKGTAAVTERNAAVHAAVGLLLQQFGRQRMNELAEIPASFFGGTVFRQLTREGHETARFIGQHGRSPWLGSVRAPAHNRGA